MKYLVKFGLMATMLMTVASSAFAGGLTGINLGGSDVVYNVPEPGSLLLLAAGVLALGIIKRKK